MSHSSYNSIDSLRLCIQEIKKYYSSKNEVIPEFIDFYGTIKLHGTNAGVGFNNQKGMWCQSRSNIITPKQDNANFAEFVEKNKEKFEDLFDIIEKKYSINVDTHSIIIFGEWCGSRIQSKVAICEMARFFAIFDVKIVKNDNKEDNYYLNSTFPEIKSDFDSRIFNINEFKTYQIRLNFSDLVTTQDELIKYIEEIEVQCPFAKIFEKKGPGEGIVFKTFINDKERFVFKVKGDEHKASKERRKVEVTNEHYSTYEKFIERVVTHNRLIQAMDYIYKFDSSLETYNKTPSLADIKHIASWIKNDIYKEEKDTIECNDFDHAKLDKLISKASYKMFNDEMKNNFS